MKIVLYAVSSQHASELIETARQLGWEISAQVRNLPGATVPAEVESPVELEHLSSELLALPFAVPQTNPEHRYAAVADALARGFTEMATIVDPSAVVAASATVGNGCYVGAGSVLGAGSTIGVACLINRSASIAHHVVLGDYVATGPGVILAGSCQVGSGAFIGAGAVLAPEVHIGAGAAIGAGAVVIADVGAHEVVVGNPARLLRRRRPQSQVPWG